MSTVKAKKLSKQLNLNQRTVNRKLRMEAERKALARKAGKS